MFSSAGAFEMNKKSSIIIGKNADETEIFASKELQQMLHKITGMALNVVKGGKPRNNDIVIGTSETSEAVKSVAGRLKLGTGNKQKTAIYAIDGKLYLGGNSPRAALYAVYTFLDEVLHVKWLWPGENGEFYKKQKPVSIPDDLSINRQPAFKFRGYHVCYRKDKDTELWMARNRMNFLRSNGFRERKSVVSSRIKMGHYVVFSGHNIKLDKKYLKTNPEYFALVNNQRNTSQLCWSNDDVAKLIADKCIRAWKDYPRLDYIIMSASDNTLRCTCEKCKNIAPSQLWHNFLTRIINYADKEFPDGKYGTFAYSMYQNPPEKPAPLDLLELCFYNRCYRHNMDCKCNSNARSLTEKWLKFNIPITIYGYEFDMFIPESEFVNLAPVLQDQAKWMQKQKLSGAVSEVTPPMTVKTDHNVPPGILKMWPSYRFSLYADARLLCNPDESLDTILDGWCSRVYGSAAEPMKEYYKIMGTAWQQAVKNISYFGTPPTGAIDGYITPALIKRVDKLFIKAEARAAGVSDAAKKETVMSQLKIEKKLFEDWKKIYSRSKLIMTRSQIQIPLFAESEVGDNLADCKLWEKATVLPDFFGKNNKPVKKAKSEVCVFSTPKALYLKAVCDDPDINAILSNGKEHDSDVWGSECLEIFLSGCRFNPGQYGHLAVNPEGVRYDATGLSGMTFDKRWEPEWTTRAVLNKTNWTVYIRISAKDIGGDFKINDELKFGMVRSVNGRKDISASGFPVLAYHNLASLGTLVIVSPEKLTGKRIVLFNGGYDSNAVAAELSKLGWYVISTDNHANLLKALKQKCDVLVVKGGKKYLTTKFIKKYLKPYVDKGGILVLGYSAKPDMKGCFDAPELAVDKGAWRGKSSRRSVFIADGEWKTKPHNMENILKNNHVPSYGFIANSKAWRKLACSKDKDGKQIAYLMSANYGKGKIVLTGGCLGMLGGASMFGNKKPANTAFLLDNLYYNFTSK
jgi:hypothetical protein